MPLCLRLQRHVHHGLQRHRAQVGGVMQGRISLDLLVKVGTCISAIPALNFREAAECVSDVFKYSIRDL